MEEETKRLIDEIRQITVQYRSEVGSARKPWPWSIRDRVERLAILGYSVKKVADLTGVPYFSILHWRSREREKFHSIAVKDQSPRKAATVAVAKTEVEESNVRRDTRLPNATVTVATPDGYQIKIDGVEAAVAILNRLRGQKCF